MLPNVAFNFNLRRYDLLDFFDLSKHSNTNPGYSVNRHVHALAPGGDPADRCTLEVAKVGRRRDTTLTVCS